MDSMKRFASREFTKPESCTIFDVYNDIQFKMAKLFIDTRTEKEYNKQHIRSAVNIPLSSFDLFRLDSNFLGSKIDSFIARKIYAISKIIWYGNHPFNRNNAKQQLFYQRSTDLIMEKIKLKNKNKINLNEFNEAPFKTPKIYLLNCSYTEFESKYPFLCDNKRPYTDPNTDVTAAKSQLLMDFISIYTNRKMGIKNSLKVYPSQIINDRFFLGNASQCSDETILQNLGITHIVNCTRTLNNEFERQVTPKYASPSPTTTATRSTSDFSIHTSPSYTDLCENITKNDPNSYHAQYIRIPVYDIPDQDIRRYFLAAIQFIENAFSDSSTNKILCHCHAGISRSSVITICYLMYAQNLSFVEALVLVQSRRAIVNPNRGFRGQLIVFEKYLNAKRKALNKSKLKMEDLSDFILQDVSRQNSDSFFILPTYIQSLSVINDEKEDIIFLGGALKIRVKEYFFSLMYDDIDFFLEKYGSMINNQLPQLFGILIEDIFLNEKNCNCQLFILLMVELFKSKHISNLNNNFVDDALCGFLAQNLYDNLVDCPHFLQFIAALFAQLFNGGYLLPQCLVLFCESSMKYQKLKIIDEQQTMTNDVNKNMDEVSEKYIQRQIELIKFQCSKIVLYTLKELELLNSVEIMSKFKHIKLENIIVSNAFQQSDQRYLSYICR